jgi:hypothetical protein
MADLTHPTDAFGVPERHFLRLAVDLLSGLELQTRERGYSTLASLVDIAKSEAEDALRAATVPDEHKLHRLVNAIRAEAAKQP